jgi:hypothetical protein
MRGELGVRCGVQFSEPLVARIERRNSALRKAHHGDPVRVDPCMLSEPSQHPIGINHHCQAIDLRLIAPRVDDAAAGERVQDERGDSDGVQLLCPTVSRTADVSTTAGSLSEPGFGITFAWTTASLQAQTVVRMEIHPIETVTLKTKPFLLGNLDGKATVIAGELSSRNA